METGVISVTSSDEDEDEDEERDATDSPPDLIATSDTDMDDLDLDPEQRDVLADVQETLQTLGALELELTNPADLERARQELPTDPDRAELLAAALPYPLAATIEYVHPSDRQDGYWRRSPDRSITAASTAQLRHRLAFTKANISNRGETGITRTEDDRGISRSARKVGDQLRDESFDAPSDPPSERESERGGKLLSTIRRFLR